MKHDLAWFTARIGKDIIRTYKGNDTVVTIVKNEKADQYMFGLQDEGFTFRDTAETIAEASTMDLEQFMDKKKATGVKVHVGGSQCISCEG